VSDLLFPTVITSRVSGLATNFKYYVFVCQPRDSRQGSWYLQCGERAADRGPIHLREFVIDDDEMVPFPEFFEDIQNLVHTDLLSSSEVLQGNRSIYTIVRNIIAWYVDKAHPSVDEPERLKYAPYEGKGSSIIWALTILLYGVDEPDTRTALMNLELAIMKGQESAQKVARELEVDFHENGGIVTPDFRRMQTRNNSVSSTPPITVAPVNETNSNLEPIVVPAEVTVGETTSPVDEMVATEITLLFPRSSTRPIMTVAAATTVTAARIEQMIAMEMPTQITLQTAGRVMSAESSIETTARIPSNWQWR
jgi:hypothetical protein